MQIYLSEEIERFVREQLASGKFDNPTDVVETALRQMRDRSRKLADIQRRMLEADLDPAVPVG